MISCEQVLWQHHGKIDAWLQDEEGALSSMEKETRGHTEGILEMEIEQYCKGTRKKDATNNNS